MNGRETVEALVATINDVPGMDDLFHEDAVMEWPQSGERIVGGDNRRGLYNDLWIAESTLDYGGGAVYQAVSIFEMRGGKIAKETAYWAEPFPAPEWRAAWIESMDA